MALYDLVPDALYHLATASEWERYREQGRIAPASLVDEGFIHCSWGRQVAGTVAKHFAGAADLLALELDPGALVDGELREEDSYGSGQSFPHVYGTIPAGAVVGRVPVP